MPLKKLLLKPGVNRENTRYTTEGGWYDCDKIRFRQGTPEKIGGWIQYNGVQFLGVCRSLLKWVTLSNQILLGVGTNLKYYLEVGTVFYDITPIRRTSSVGAVTFAATNGSTTITVTDVGNGAGVGDFVTFSGAVSLGGVITDEVLNKEYEVVSLIDDDNYTITSAVAANASDTGNGGTSVVGAYQLTIGVAVEQALTGWGAGPFSFGTWGQGTAASLEALRLWNNQNFGEDLIYGPRGGGIYYWDATNGVGSRGVALAGADVPTLQNNIIVSDVSRFVLCFGVNPLGEGAIDPMLIRWSDQEDPTNWAPAITNQAGSIRLSIGSSIITARQTRQEILVWTDAALYSLQYLGPPFVWGAQTVGENISIISPNASATANNITYWMGTDKFYKYDGRVQTLRCDLRQFIFQNSDPTLTLDRAQNQQVFASTVEAFNEVWWFYCSSGETAPNRYVVYNYVEDAWYYGTMGRTAWLDSGLNAVPIAATPNNILTSQETGVDDGETGTLAPIEAYITSSEFDIDDGHNFGFVWRLLPDLTFRGSTSDAPVANFSLLPMQNSGSGYNSPASVGGSNNANVSRIATVPIEQFTGQINTRVRGRQLAMKIESTALGTTWQLGAPRIDIRPDGTAVMASIITSDFEINRAASPRLPVATSEYNRQYQDQLNNILRLYFNQIDNTLKQFDSDSTVIPPTTVFTVATLPSAATSGVGARAFVSDAASPTFGATVVGSGAVTVPVYSDGTNWKVG
jgi:hypothetical protein